MAAPDLILPGLDLEALSRWLDDRHPELRTGPLRAEPLTGGRSNLTYRLTDGTHLWALRRPPLDHLLATAHDMAREHTILHALKGSGVPVAEPVALCDSDEVLGAPFYLMQYVEGVVLESVSQVEAVDERTARHVCLEMVDTLLALHALDLDVVGLGGWRRREGFLPRQLRRWSAQWDSSAIQPRSEFDTLLAQLRQSCPPQRSETLVHGDFRLSNLRFDHDLRRVAAVVDWEMATAGDPLTDLGLLVAYQQLSFDGVLVAPALPADAGYLTSEEIVDRYGAGSLCELDALDWYVAFAYMKLAVIAEGIHHRFRSGHTVGEGFDQFGPAVPRLLHNALEHLTRHEPGEH